MMNPNPDPHFGGIAPPIMGHGMMPHFGRAGAFGMMGGGFPRPPPPPNFGQAKAR